MCSLTTEYVLRMCSLTTECVLRMCSLMRNVFSYCVQRRLLALSAEDDNIEVLPRILLLFTTPLYYSSLLLLFTTPLYYLALSDEDDNIEVRVSVKRDLFIWQKRPIHMAKEAYSYGKRDLFIWQKRPITISIPQGVREEQAPQALPTPSTLLPTPALSLSLSLSAYIICIYIYTYTLHIHIHVCVCVCVYVCVYTYVNIFLGMCMHQSFFDPRIPLLPYEKASFE